MASGIASPLIRAIYETTGMKAPEFAETVLGLKYTTFNYRVRNGVLRFVDYLKICEATGLSLADLFKLLGGDVVRLPVVEPSPGFQEVTALDAVRNHMQDVIPRQQPPEQKKEPVEAPFVVEDLPLTMPGE